jgi:23S rRNA (uracil1939-C5)-methyltransferase
MTETELEVTALGAQGDGIAEGPGGTRVFVPFGTPGDRVRARVEGDRATILAILAPGPARVPAFCRHFGACGGCATQHVAIEAAAEWKRGLVAASLRHRGLDPSIVAPTIVAAPRARRRVTFQARREGGRLRFGYAERGTHRLVDIAECPIVVPALAALITPLRALADRIAGKRDEVRMLATATETGVDLAVEAKRPLDLPLREELAALAVRLDLARIAWGTELVAELRAPLVTFGRARVSPPPGAFLQPSREGEEALAGLVVEGLGGSARVADLFAGCGTFSLRIAERAQVAAFEGEAAMVSALLAGARATAGLKPVRAERRDLFRRPLVGDELAGFDAVVFDPPRAGAAAEAAALAVAPASVRRIVAVSCAAATFARDARTLVDGGWRLAAVTPVDQFAFTPHIELVARFTRGS